MASDTRTVPGATGTRRRNRAIGVAGAVAASAAVWVVGEPLLGHDLVVEQPGRPAMDLGLGAVVFVTLLFSLLGWGLLAVLERVTSRGGLIWTVLAALVLAISFLPLTGVDATGGTKTVLGLMHLAVGGVLIPVFWRTTSGPRSG